MEDEDTTRMLVFIVKSNGVILHGTWNSGQKFFDLIPPSVSKDSAILAAAPRCS